MLGKNKAQAAIFLTKAQGSSIEALKAHMPQLNINERIFLIDRVLKFMAMLHHEGLAHRDFSASNFFVSFKGEMKTLEVDRGAMKAIGTVAYSPREGGVGLSFLTPDLMEDQHIVSSKDDSVAVAIILAIIAGYNDEQIIGKNRLDLIDKIWKILEYIQTIIVQRPKIEERLIELAMKLSPLEQVVTRLTKEEDETALSQATTALEKAKAEYQELNKKQLERVDELEQLIKTNKTLMDQLSLIEFDFDVLTCSNGLSALNPILSKLSTIDVNSRYGAAEALKDWTSTDLMNKSLNAAWSTLENGLKESNKELSRYRENPTSMRWFMAKKTSSSFKTKVVALNALANAINDSIEELMNIPEADRTYEKYEEIFQSIHDQLSNLEVPDGLRWSYHSFVNMLIRPVNAIIRTIADYNNQIDYYEANSVSSTKKLKEKLPTLYRRGSDEEKCSEHVSEIQLKFRSL